MFLIYLLHFLIFINLWTFGIFDNFYNATLKSDNYLLSPGIPLNSHYKIDYRNRYNLRFDPKSIRRSFRIRFDNNSENLLSEIDDKKDINNSVNEISSETEINSCLNLTKIPYFNLNKNSSKLENLETSTISLTNIMKPEKNRTTLNMIGNRLKSLLFGNAATLLPSPSHPKGFLNLFDVIKFENTPCTVSLNGVRILNGTCYHRYECDVFGGFARGICAGGYGVCCVFKYSCGRTTNQAVSYFESPNFPTTVAEPLTCIMTLDLLPNVRQIRIDFLFFELNRPTKGDCVDDQFIITGQNINFFVPILCGVNTGQHIYIDVENSVQRKLFLSIFGKNPEKRAFSMRLTQLKNNYAPDGCLQYYTENNGFLKSFNYDLIGNIVQSRRASYFNNLNYAICIKRAPGMCTITYSNELNGEEFPFELVNPEAENTVEFGSGRQAGADVLNCPCDFVVIDALRLCGSKLNDGGITEDYNVNSPITDYGAGPIILQFRTDNETVGRGFKLAYYQQSCS